MSRLLNGESEMHEAGKSCDFWDIFEATDCRASLVELAEVRGTMAMGAEPRNDKQAG